MKLYYIYLSIVIICLYYLYIYCHKIEYFQPKLNIKNHSRCLQNNPVDKSVDNSYTLDIHKCLSTPTCGIYYDSHNISKGLCLKGTAEGPSLTLPADILPHPSKINKSDYTTDIYKSKKWVYSTPNMFI